jgi:hypothetical protein
LHPAPVREQVVTHSGGGSGLAETAAESYAIQFVFAYLNYDSRSPSAHQQALQPYLGQGVDDPWDGNGQQQVLQAQAMAALRRPAGLVLVQVAAYVSSTPAGSGSQGQTRWLYLSVPVRESSGGLAIVGPPATIPPPQTAQPPEESPPPPAEDSSLTSQLRPAASGFFSAWANGNESQLAYYTATGTSIPSLQNQVRFAALPNFSVAEGGGATRTSTAQVSWADPVTGARFTQGYTVGWRYQDGRWLISSVSPSN